MNLTLEGLKASGGFVGRPVQREITFQSGDGQEVTATVWVRPLSYQSTVSDVLSHAMKRDAIAGRIAACICDEEGKSIFTVEDVTGEADPERGPLSQSLTMALLSVIGEVTGGGKPKD